MKLFACKPIDWVCQCLKRNVQLKSADTCLVCDATRPVSSLCTCQGQMKIADVPSTCCAGKFLIYPLQRLQPTGFDFYPSEFSWDKTLIYCEDCQSLFPSSHGHSQLSKHDTVTALCVPSRASDVPYAAFYSLSSKVSPSIPRSYCACGFFRSGSPRCIRCGVFSQDTVYQIPNFKATVFQPVLPNRRDPAAFFCLSCQQSVDEKKGYCGCGSSVSKIPIYPWWHPLRFDGTKCVPDDTTDPSELSWLTVPTVCMCGGTHRQQLVTHSTARQAGFFTMEKASWICTGCNTHRVTEPCPKGCGSHRHVQRKCGCQLTEAATAQCRNCGEFYHNVYPFQSRFLTLEVAKQWSPSGIRSTFSGVGSVCVECGEIGQCGCRRMRVTLFYWWTDTWKERAFTCVSQIVNNHFPVGLKADNYYNGRPNGLPECGVKLHNSQLRFFFREDGRMKFMIRIGNQLLWREISRKGTSLIVAGSEKTFETFESLSVFAKDEERIILYGWPGVVM